MVSPLLYLILPLHPNLFSEKQDTRQLGFTYVQGMNVLAAPFLYTMPSELEAFFCFAKFIEECCPLYVQPTLEGVHRGLKAYSLSNTDKARSNLRFSATRSLFANSGPRFVH